MLQRTLLTVLANGGPASSVTLNAMLGSGYSNFRILTSLRELQHLRLVEKTGSTRGARWRLAGQVIP